MILIGSSAIKIIYPDFPRVPKDLDYATEDRRASGIQNVEYLYNPVLCKWYGKLPYHDLLLTLKASHLFWDIQWEKHMFDAQFLIKKGAIIHWDLFLELYAFWNQEHGANKRSDLAMSAEDFFDNNLSCEYNHDWLHTLLAETPTYTKVLADGCEVEVSEEKFNKLSFEDKEALVREEVMVMAFERYAGRGYLGAYSTMLKKFIISHAPLWEAVFIIENYVALHKAKFDFIKHLNNKIDDYKRTI